MLCHAVLCLVPPLALFPPPPTHTSHHPPPQSMLSKQQSQWAKEMLSNIRLACCVAGGMNVVVKEEDLLEVGVGGSEGGE